MEYAHARYGGLSEQLTLHVGGEERLLNRARQCAQPTELVVAPVELHQRNVQRRLRERNAPKDAFVFDDPVGVSRRLLTVANVPSQAIDRIDRLALVRAVLGNSGAEENASIPLPPGTPSRDPQTVEQLRTEVETITNFHPERIDAWRNATELLYTPIDAEAMELLRTSIEIERSLRERTSKAISETELVRRATRTLVSTNGSVWADAYSGIERFTLVGMSSLSAPHADLVHALLEATSIDVHIYFREGTGEFLRSRTPALLDVTDPGSEVFE